MEKIKSYFQITLTILALMTSVISVSGVYFKTEADTRKNTRDISNIYEILKDLKEEQDGDNHRQDENNYRFQHEMRTQLTRIEDQLSKVKETTAAIKGKMRIN